ncbi:hypothetical protein ACJMK2_037947 [Sinanodonta woodiana]|uniref:Uncharacterized protein n=1 Tax=Sinanodonta woodiana TaxID=1069815 RepID=A0ABD3WR83_SINWO
MLKRPNPGETEEDLLRIQDECLAARDKSAARAIKQFILSSTEATPPKKSRFRAKQEEKKELHSAQADNDVDMEHEIDSKTSNL